MHFRRTFFVIFYPNFGHVNNAERKYCFIVSFSTLTNVCQIVYYNISTPPKITISVNKFLGQYILIEQKYVLYLLNICAQTKQTDYQPIVKTTK